MMMTSSFMSTGCVPGAGVAGSLLICVPLIATSLRKACVPPAGGVNRTLVSVDVATSLITLTASPRRPSVERVSQTARLLSVNVGLPRDIAWKGRTVHTAIWKDPVAGRRLVRRLNIDGDGQGDLGGHGGEQRAVYVYQIESYRYWEDRLGRSDLTYGQFGEN